MLYFSYGSNMVKEEMIVRCPGAEFLGLAELPGHRFVIAACGYGSVVPDPAGVVHGVLWRISEADKRRLDRYERVSEDMYRAVEVTVRESSGSDAAAIMYVAGSWSGPPAKVRRGYLQRVVRAARAAGLPESYCARLESSQAKS